MPFDNISKGVIEQREKKKEKKMKTEGEGGVLKEISQSQDQNNLLQTTSLIYSLVLLVKSVLDFSDFPIKMRILHYLVKVLHTPVK